LFRYREIYWEIDNDGVEDRRKRVAIGVAEVGMASMSWRRVGGTDIVLESFAAYKTSRIQDALFKNYENEPCR